MPWPKAHCTGQIASGYFGFNRKEEQFLTAEFRALGIAVSLTTVDGSLGIKGFVTDAMPQTGYTYLYTWWACAHSSGHRRKGCDLGTIQL